MPEIRTPPKVTRKMALKAVYTDLDKALSAAVLVSQRLEGADVYVVKAAGGFCLLTDATIMFGDAVSATVCFGDR